MRQTNNTRVADTMTLLSPTALKAELPISDAQAEVVAAARDRIRAIMRGDDQRVLVVVGPCSIHDPAAAMDYARRLSEVRARLADRLEIVMRVYFEKPRTITGWKGLINDPHLDGSFDINTGLRRARSLLLDLATLGMPTATELLDPIVPQYTADLISWAAIGARTTESQTHREMASGLSMPVGFKNGTDGGLQIAVNAIESARHPHRFLGISDEGRVAIVATTGNPDAHLVLRGGLKGTNFDAGNVADATAKLRALRVTPRVMIDCSHDNAGKDHLRQKVVLEDFAGQIAGGSDSLLGVMIESHLVAGRQAIPKDLSRLVYGQSITDACVDFDSTQGMLQHLHQAVDVGASRRRQAIAKQAQG
ncbi:MAG TPA: 3-deoxy-7-phosphoheptulonate synthase [Planctomycetota bacterium]|nr:3-deoxy-7-phosphoheptulonate synthase [Planctomycetota bacterium]